MRMSQIDTDKNTSQQYKKYLCTYQKNNSNNLKFII